MQRSAKPSSPVRFRVAPPKIKTNPNGLVFIFGSPTPLRTFRFYAKSGSQIRRRARTACEVAARRDFLPAGQLPGWQLSCISGNANKRVGLNFWKFHPTSDVSRKRETRFVNPPQSANRLRGRGKARFPARRANFRVAVILCFRQGKQTGWS